MGNSLIMVYTIIQVLFTVVSWLPGTVGLTSDWVRGDYSKQCTIYTAVYAHKLYSEIAEKAQGTYKRALEGADIGLRRLTWCRNPEKIPTLDGRPLP